MKKLLLIAATILLSGCGSVLVERDILIIDEIDEGYSSKYQYNVSVEYSVDITLYSDSLYNIGDTLILIKKQ